jgi:hypothetical protein
MVCDVDQLDRELLVVLRQLSLHRIDGSSIDIDTDDARAFLAESPTETPTDTTGRTGDDDDFVVKTTHGSDPFHDSM